MTELIIGKIIEGEATRWDSKSQTLRVNIPNDTEGAEGICHAKELSMYIDSPEDSYEYTRSAAYCIGIKLNYIIIGIGDSGQLILSRKSLGEQTLKTIKDNPEIQFYGTITNINRTNMYVDIDGVSGLCQAKAATYAFVKDLSVVFEPGQTLAFTATGITSDNKLYLSHLTCVPSREETVREYDPGAVVQATILGRVDPKGDTSEKHSYFIIIDQLCSGIVEVPEDVIINYGNVITMLVKKHTPKGLRGAFVRLLKRI